jgi:hypothetical protein
MLAKSNYYSAINTWNLEVGFPDPIFELEIRKILGTNHSILRYTKVDQNMKNKKK